MITIREQLSVPKPANAVWSFLENLDEFAACVPTLKEWRRVENNVIAGKVGIVLGAIPVESHVRLEICHHSASRCIEARGTSFLGETITQLRGGKEGQIRANDSGRLVLHVDVRPDGADSTHLLLLAGVEAEGRLRRIYESIVRLKVPALKDEFSRKLSLALGVEVTRMNGNLPMCKEPEAILAGASQPSSAEAPPVSPRPALWQRIIDWVRDLLGLSRA